MRRNNWKRRTAAVLLSAFMVAGMIPVTAFADDTESAAEETQDTPAFSEDTEQTEDTSFDNAETADENEDNEDAVNEEPAPEPAKEAVGRKVPAVNLGAEPKAADDPFELKVTVTPDGGSAIELTEDGVTYVSDNRSKTYTVHFYVKYPTAANKELEIQLPYGMAWATGYHSGWSFNGHESETWYQEVASFTTPNQQTDPDKQSHTLNGQGMADGALTIHWKDGLETAEFDLVIATTELYDIAQTGLLSIEDAVLVSLSYDGGVKKTIHMDLKQPYLKLTPDKFQVNNVDVDDQKRIKVLEDGSNTNSVYFGAVPETTGGHMYKDDYELLFEMPAGVIWEKTLNSNNQPYTLLGTPTLHQAGEVLTLSDGTQYTIPEGKQVYTFAASDPARIQAPAAGNRAFGPIWNFPKEDFPAGTEVTIRMLDVKMEYWMSDTYETYDRSKLPEATYIIVAPEEEIYINTSTTGPRSAYRDANTLSLGIPDFKNSQEERAGVFRIGNRKIGDSRPKLMTYVYDVNNTGFGGITEQTLYSIVNDPVYGTVTLSNFKVKLWKPGDAASETDWITLDQTTGGTIRMTDVPGWTDGYYLRSIQFEVDRIPALSQKEMDTFYGVELTEEPCTDRRFLSTLTIEDLPGSGYTDTVTGGEYTFFSGKTIIPAYPIDNGNGVRTINAGETKQLRFRINGGNRTNYLEEIYLISPYGDPYTNIQAEVPINSRSLSGYTAVKPVVTEIDAAYGDGSFEPSEAFTEKYPNARVYKLDFTGITEPHEMYLSRQYGQTDATAKARAEDDMPIANNLSSMLWISFTMEAGKKDPSGKTDQDLMWVKVWRPDDLSNVTFESISTAPFVADVYNLTGDTSTLLHKGIDITVINKEEVQVIPAVKKTSDPDDAYQTWDGTDDTVVRSNQIFDYQLEIFNSSTHDAKGLQIYIPVPKDKEFWGKEFQVETPFMYDMSLTGEIDLPDGYEAAYVKGAEPSNQHDVWDTYNWVTDTSAWTQDDWDQVNFIKIINTEGTVIKPGTDVYAYFELKTNEYSEADLEGNDKNIWRPYYLRELSGVSAFRAGENTATALVPAYLSGIVFEDLKNDGIFDPDDSKLPDKGIPNAAVEVWREVEGRRALTKIAETKTDDNGRYVFDKLIEDQEYTIVVINPDTDTYFSFSINGPAAGRFDPAEDQSQASAKGTAQITGTGDHMNADSGLLVPVSIEVTKKWDDSDNQDGFRPESITVTLKGAEKDIEQELTAKDADPDDETGNTWIYTFKKLLDYDDGEKIEYSVEETTTSVITGTDGPGTYAFSITGNEEDGFVITNTHTPEVIDIKTSKIWDDDDNADQIRPDSVSAVLNRVEEGSSIEIDTKELNGNNQWTCTWTVPKYLQQKQAVYKVTEIVPDGYEASVEDVGEKGTEFIITNTHISEKTNYTVVKVWDDDDDRDRKRPESLTVNLLADGEVIDTTELSEENEWTYTWENLTKNEPGKEELLVPIKYTVEEVLPEDSEYTAEDPKIETDEEGTTATFTNVYEPETVTINVTKVWNDASDKDRVRPASIVVVLSANGEEVTRQTVATVKGKDEQTFVFGSEEEPLYVYEEGKKIVYSVTEVPVQKYSTEIKAGKDSEYTFVITNTHLSDKEDSGSQDRIPDTSDHSSAAMWTMLMFMSIAAAAGTVIFRFRHSKTQ